MNRTAGSIALSLALIAAGCGGPSGAPNDIRASAVPVSGKVLWADGRPLAHGWVVFTPKTVPAQEANAPTGPDGTFHLSTFGKGDGAIPGRYVVTVEPHPNARPKPRIPAKYASEK